MCAAVVRKLEGQDQGPDLAVDCKCNRVIIASEQHCRSGIARLNVSGIYRIHQSLKFGSGSLEFDIAFPTGFFAHPCWMIFTMKLFLDFAEERAQIGVIGCINE